MNDGLVDKVVNGTLVLCGVVLLGMVGFMLYAIPWHNLWCDVGHYETVHVKAYWMSNVISHGNGQVTIVPTFIPDHDEDVWVCDHGKSSKGE